MSFLALPPDGATLRAIAVAVNALRKIIGAADEPTSPGSATKFLNEAGHYVTNAGGDVVGPGVAVNNHVAFFDGTTGKLIKDSGLALSGSNTGDQTLSDATITTSDITTNDVSITKHGFAPKAPNDARKYFDGTGAYSALDGGAFATQVVRASNIQSSSAASYVITWPTGTVAGDYVFIFAGHAFSINTPTGWFQIDAQTGTNWNGAAFWRFLNATDIAAGNVTVTTGGSGNGVFAAVTLIGAHGFIRTPITSSRNSTGAASRTLNTDGALQTTDLVLYFASNRNNSANTVSLGSSQQTISAAAASGALYAGSPAAAGGISPVFSYSVSSGTTGDYQAAIALKGSN